jgi:hypothetical protein
VNNSANVMETNRFIFDYKHKEIIVPKLDS